MKILSRKRDITLSNKLKDKHSFWYGSPFDSEQLSEFKVNISSNNRDI